EISGIDTPEIREVLVGIFGDKRLGFQPTALLQKIKEGTLKLNQVHPVRAAVLVGRLKGTGLKVKWAAEQMIKSLVVLFICFLGMRAFGNDWEHHEANLKDYSIKIINFQDEIHELQGKKKLETEPKKREELLIEIKKKYTELKDTHKD